MWRHTQLYACACEVRHTQLYACVVGRLGKSPHTPSHVTLLPTPYSTCMGGSKNSHWWNDDMKSKKPSRGLKICTKSLDLRGQKGNILPVL